MFTQDLLCVRSFVAVSAVVGLLFAGAAQGAVTVTKTTDIAPAGGAVHQSYTPFAFSASGSDLAEGVIASSTGNVIGEESGGAAQWTNTSLDTVYAEGGLGGNDVDHAGYGTVNNGDTIIFDLGGLFNLTQIDVFAGWNDSGRDEFSFDLLVSYDDVNYSTIATYTKGPDNTGDFTTPITSRITILDNGGADIASNVRYVRLDIVDADNGYAGMAEFDVFGTPIPEPTSLALLAFGGLAMVIRRRRSRAVEA